MIIANCKQHKTNCQKNALCPTRLMKITRYRQVPFLLHRMLKKKKKWAIEKGILEDKPVFIYTFKSYAYD